MNVIEKYTRAVNSSNLRDDEQHHATDVLAATALCETRLATKLFRVKYAGDATTYAALLAEWTEIVTFKSLLRTWPIEVSPKKVARLSLDHWLNDVCPVCTGTGLQLGVGHTDAACKACNGTAKRPVQVKHSVQDYVRDMVESLEAMTIQAGGEAMRKLARAMDF
ncbi:hypothetical protein FHW67_002729 [Herbaspirillum sp. Sphag1AN]|uniref:hypothetical protein n=1 Tax=unclassified Herbaspirillum TaxID=2624150 RepID=UPI001615A989|nr:MULTISPECIES: hypothetical protein [unclassified Herbaspirillum]MBB3213437.1 hypothetical protein [Herbaspirillum sp. Sphag1AN]MBB3246519.1 hypothetical protein [Herbaspirillum sp. Sphag64]